MSLKEYKILSNYIVVSLHCTRNGQDQENNPQEMMVMIQRKEHPHSLLVGLETGATVETSVRSSQKSQK